MTASATPLSIVIKCDTCHRERGDHFSIFLEMAPKIDTTDPYYLCVKCYVEDYKRFDATHGKATAIVEAPRPLVVTVPVEPVEPPAQPAARGGRKRAQPTGSR